MKASKANVMFDTQKKIKGYYVCGKFGHFARVCQYRKNSTDRPKNNGGKDAPNPQTNVLIGSGSIGDDERYELTNIETNLICESTEWWNDTGANVHVCSNFSCISNYQEIKEKFVTMDNATVAQVLGVGIVIFGSHWEIL